eukprot:4626517-Amphidinium_carterae.1
MNRRLYKATSVQPVRLKPFASSSAMFVCLRLSHFIYFRAGVSPCRSCMPLAQTAIASSEMERQPMCRGGYSNRSSLAIDPKHPNRHRLLTAPALDAFASAVYEVEQPRLSFPCTAKSSVLCLIEDRNAYISYLEGLVERADVAQAEADACSKGLYEMRNRIADLEDKVRLGNETAALQRQDRDRNGYCQKDTPLLSKAGLAPFDQVAIPNCLGPPLDPK